MSEGQGGSPRFNAPKAIFLHTLREKAFVTTEFAADSGFVVHNPFLIFNFFSKRMNNPG